MAGMAEVKTLTLALPQPPKADQPSAEAGEETDGSE